MEVESLREPEPRVLGFTCIWASIRPIRLIRLSDRSLTDWNSYRINVQNKILTMLSKTINTNYKWPNSSRLAFGYYSTLTHREFREKTEELKFNGRSH